MGPRHSPGPVSPSFSWAPGSGLRGLATTVDNWVNSSAELCGLRADSAFSCPGSVPVRWSGLNSDNEREKGRVEG